MPRRPGASGHRTPAAARSAAGPETAAAPNRASPRPTAPRPPNTDLRARACPGTAAASAADWRGRQPIPGSGAPDAGYRSPRESRRRDPHWRGAGQPPARDGGPAPRQKRSAGPAGIHGTGEETHRAPGARLRQTRAPECRSAARLLQTRSESGRSRHQVARDKGLTSSCTPRTSFCVSSKAEAPATAAAQRLGEAGPGTLRSCRWRRCAVISDICCAALSCPPPVSRSCRRQDRSMGHG